MCCMTWYFRYKFNIFNTYFIPGIFLPYMKKLRNFEQIPKLRSFSKIFIWRRKRDLNPRAGFPTYSLSRGAPSPLGYFCKIWRREWDSNPRSLAGSLVFKTSSLNHSDISPYFKLITNQLLYYTSFSDVCQVFFQTFFENWDFYF